MKFSNQLVLLFTALLLINCSKKEDVCHIHGTVVDTDTKTILLARLNQDIVHDSVIEIPVINGKFDYKLHVEKPEAYELALKESVKSGMFRFSTVFIENTDINITIHPDEDFDKNTVEGGKLNSEFFHYKKDKDKKFKTRSEAINSLSEKANTPELERDVLDSIGKYYKDEQKWKQQYINKNNTLVSYYLLINSIIFDKENIDILEVKKSFEKLSKQFPNHPYNELALNLINAMSIEAGKKFIDFTAPDLNGNPITLSSQIEGKVALLDLWATWCGPCITKSRTMVPIYNDYKDKGFTVVGVAREKDNTKRLTEFLEKEKWPWQQLVDLDGENKIWQKYGIPNGGGKIFLIDKTGTVLAVNPTVEEVRQHLEKILN